MDAKSLAVSCPRCGAPALWDASNPHRPFCSEKCRLLDLGAWLSEEYRVPCATPEGEESDSDSTDGRPDEAHPSESE